MSARRRAPNGAPDSLVTMNADDAQTSTTLASDPLPTVKVNNANLNEIKAALDEIVKQYLIDQSFTPSNLNPTIHLALGYSSVILSLGGMLYSWKISFEESKPVLWLAVSGYFVLQGILWAWKRWVEKGEVFRGKRRRVVKRIETDHVQLTTSTTLESPPLPQLTFSPHTRPSSPTGTVSNSPSTTSPSSPSQATAKSPSAATTTSTTFTSGKGAGPSYLLHMTLSTTSNNGKSLINKARIVQGRGIGEFVDEAGGVEEGEVRRWVAGVLNEAGLAGTEDEGLKAE